RFMEERRRIQVRRVRSDAEILPLLGRAYEPQFAGTEYARAARDLAGALQLYGITSQGAPNKVLVLASAGEEQAALDLAARLQDHAPVAVPVALAVVLDEEPAAPFASENGFAAHRRGQADPALLGLIEQADAVLAFAGALHLPALANSLTPVAIVGEPPGASPLKQAAVIAPGD